MTHATLLTLTTTYQYQIAQHDLAMHQTLATAHEQAVRQIQPQLDRLYREMEQKHQAEEEVTLSFLYQHKRMQTIKQTVKQHIDAFALLAQMMNTQAHQQGVTLGSQSGLAQVRDVANGHVITTPSDKALNAVSEHQEGTHSSLFHGYGAEAAQDVARTLVTGVSLKQPIKQIASSVLGKLKTSLNRAIVTVGETFMDAYRGVVSLFYRANAKIIGEWMWKSEVDACPICLRLNGSRHSITEKFKTPHPFCRCGAVPVPRSEVS